MTQAVEDMERSAVISDCGRYRYRLIRRWAPGPLVNFVMLNPSTADATEDDPTIRRCVGFARKWGYDGIVVTNLFAYRSTDPAALKKLPLDVPIGPENDRYLENEADKAGLIVAAWGANPTEGRSTLVLGMLRRMLGESGRKIYCLGKTQMGQPVHPLFIPARMRPVPLD